MVTVSDIVSSWVRKRPFVQEALVGGLINTSALAREIMPEIEEVTGKEAKITTVVMALQRMDHGAVLYETKRLEEFFSKIKDLLVRSGITVYTLRNQEDIIGKIAALLECIEGRHDIMCTFSQGVGEYTLIISSVAERFVQDTFDEDDITMIEKNLTAFTLMLPNENRHLSGVYYFVLRQLAWKGINITEVVSTSNEFTIVIEDEQSTEAFQVLSSLGKGK